MENRERDRVSQRASPTEAGQINRKVSEERGREQNSGNSAEFGQSIGRAENLEGGEMENRNRDRESNLNKNVGVGSEKEQSRRPSEGGFGSSSGRQSGSMGSESSDISREDKSPGRNSGTGSLDRDEQH